MQIYIKKVNDDVLPASEIHNSIKASLPDKKYRSILKRKMSIYAYDLLLQALYQSNNITDAIIAFEEKGKPYLKNYPNIHIGISHSGNYAACIIDNAPCGIDIEQYRTINSRIYRKALSSAETDWVNLAKDEQEQNIRFLRLWTMKEAYLKKTGEGITVKLQNISLIKNNILIKTYNGSQFISFDTDKYILTAYSDSNEIDIHYI